MTARVIEQAPQVAESALRNGFAYSAGWGDTADDPSFAVFVVTGEMAEKFKPMLSTLRDLAREFA